ncbi:hypothetical protein B0A78_12535 [Flavobacterium columnare NBRC 100251 = ATCC 23463]|uniref:hypothetical protein n=1 Tax=Flavobacterium columnare TaxID=996 RepID=UPI000BE88A61|nr:hypothetical protein [Flavobacterium columnare]PDS22227.1 hypothetical protein B0A78_12535 [Flavobacterium columnare NBRC 100251 = ATCC 23463]GEM58573.1 hypothetical protein FC1_18110 [Flavobacterium columnare NBRC 100251 = ATCC 23463]
MNIKLKITLLLLSGIAVQPIVAQGCSDAGFCSVGNPFKTINNDIKNYVEVNTGYGLGEQNVGIISSHIAYTRLFTDKFAMNVKVTGLSANGNLGTKTNIGDLFVTANYKLSNSEKMKWSGVLGLKIPLTNANDKINNVSLPMPYQSSLGIYDLIAGIEAGIKNWDFNLATQIPLTDNKNSYLSNLSSNQEFVSTNLFHRSPDLLFRPTYKIVLANDQLTLKPNLLFIYHLGNDSYIDQLNQKIEIANSNGLTLNGNVIANYKLGANSSIETSLAAPFVIRKVRPDGLTRSFTFGITFKQGF